MGFPLARFFLWLRRRRRRAEPEFTFDVRSNLHFNTTADYLCLQEDADYWDHLLQLQDDEATGRPWWDLRSYQDYRDLVEQWDSIGRTQWDLLAGSYQDYGKQASAYWDHLMYWDGLLQEQWDSLGKVQGPLRNYQEYGKQVKVHWDHLLQVQGEQWDRIRRTQESAKSYQEYGRHLLSTPAFFLGIGQVAVFCLYLMLFRRAWVRRKCRRVRPRESATVTVSRRGPKQFQNDRIPEARKGVMAQGFPRVKSPDPAQHDIEDIPDPAQQDIEDIPDPAQQYIEDIVFQTPDASGGSNCSEEGSEDTREKQNFPPNSFTTPERSRAHQMNTPQNPASPNRPPLHPSQLPMAVAAVATSSPEASETVAALRLKLQLDQRQPQWKQFQQKIKAKQESVLHEIASLSAQLKGQEEQHQSQVATKCQDIASKVEALQAEMDKSKRQPGAPPPAQDLKLKVRQSEDDPLTSQAQSQSQAQDAGYASQLQVLQTESDINSSPTSGTDVAVEESTPETSRPPPSQNTSVSDTESPTLTPARASQLPPTQSISPPKAKVEYGALVKEVHMMTETIQRVGSEPSLRDIRTTTTDGSTTDGSLVASLVSASSHPQHYVHVLQNHLKERSADCTRLEAQVARLKSQMNGYSLELQGKQVTFDAEKASLISQLKSLQTTNEVQKDSLTRYQTLCASIKSEKAQVEEELESLKELPAKVDSMKDECDMRLHAQQKEHQKSLAQVQAELVIEKERVVEWQFKHEAVSTGLDKWRKKVSQLEQDAANKETSWQQKVQSLQQELQAEQDEHRQDVEQRDEHCQVLSDRIDALETQVTAGQKELISFQGAASSKEGELTDQIRWLKTKLEKTVSNLEEERDEVQEENQEVSKALENCEGCRKDMEEKFKAKEKEWKKQISSLQATVDGQGQALHEARQETETLRESLDQAKETTQSLEGIVQATKEEHESTMQALEKEWQEKLDTLRTMLEVKETLCHTLTSKANDLTKSLAKSQEEFEDATSKEIVLSAEVQSLETQLQIRTKEEKDDLARAEMLATNAKQLELQVREKEGRLEQQVENHKKTEELLKGRIQTLSEELKTKVDSVASMEKTMSSLQGLLETGDDDGNTDIVGSVQNLSSQIASLQSDLATRERVHDADIATREEEIRDMKSQLNSVVQENTSLKKSMAQVRQHLNPGSSSLHFWGSDDDNLATNAQRLTEKLDSCGEKIIAIQTEKTRLERELAAMHRTHRDQLADVEKRKSEAEATVNAQSEESRQREEAFEDFKASSDAQEQDYLEQIKQLQDLLANQPNLANEQLREAERRCDEASAMTEMYRLELATTNEEKKHLREQVAKHDAERASMSSWLANAEQQCESLNKLVQEMARLKSENEEIGQSKRLLEAALVESREKASVLQAKIIEMEERHLLDRNKKNAVEEKLTNTTTNTGDVTLQLKDVTSQLEEATEKIGTLETDLCRAQRERQDASKEKHHFLEANKVLEAAEQEAQTSLEIFKLRLSDALKEKKGFDFEKKKIIQEMENVKSQLHDSKAQLREASKKLEEAEKRGVESATKMEDKDKQCAELQSTLDMLSEKQTEELSESRAKLEEANSRIEALEAAREKLPVLEADLMQMKTKRQQIENLKLDTEKRLSAVKAKARGLEESLGRKDRAIQRTFSEKQDLNQKLSAMKSLEQDLTTAKERITELESFMESQKEELQANADQMEASAKRLQDMEQEVDEAENQNREIASTVLDLEAKVEMSKAESAKIPILQKKLEESMAELSVVKAEATERTEENQRLRDAKDKLQKLLDENGSLSEKLHTRIAELNDRVESSGRETRNLAQQLEEAKARATNFEEKFRQADDTKQVLEARYESMHQEKQEMELIVRNLTDEVEQLRTGNESMKQRLADQENAHQSSLARQEEIASEFSKLQKVHSELECKHLLLVDNAKEKDRLTMQMRMERAEAKATCEELLEKVSALSRSNKTLTAEKEALQKQVTDFKASASDLETQLQEVKQQQAIDREVLKASFSEEEMQRKQTEIELAKAEGICASLKEEVQHLGRAKAVLLDQNEKLESETKSLAQERESLLQENISMKEAIASMEDELLTTRNKLGNAEKSKGSLEERMGQAELKGKHAQEEMRLLEEEVSNQKTSVIQLETQLQEASKQVEVLENAKSALQDELDQQKRESAVVQEEADTSLEAAMSNIVGLSEKLAEMEEGKSRLEEEVEQLKERSSQDQDKMTGSETQLQAMSKQVEVLKNAKSALQEELERLKEKSCQDQNKRTGLEKALSESKAAAEALSNEIETMDAERKSALAAKDQLEQDVLKINAAASNSENEMRQRSAQVQVLENSKASQEEQIRQYKQEIEEAMEQRKTTEENLTHTKAKVDFLSNKIRNLEDANAAAVADREKLKEELTVQKAVASQTETEARQSVKNLEVLQNTKALHEEELLSSKNEANQLNEALAESRATCKLLSDKIEELEAARKSASEAKSLLDKEILDLKATVTPMEMQVQEATLQVEVLEKSKASQQKYIEATKVELAKVRAERNRLDEAVSESRARCKKLEESEKYALEEKAFIEKEMMDMKASATYIEERLQGMTKSLLKDKGFLGEEIVVELDAALAQQNEKLAQATQQVKSLTRLVASNAEVTRDLQLQLDKSNDHKRRQDLEAELAVAKYRNVSLSKKVTDLEEEKKLFVDEKDTLGQQIEDLKKASSSRDRKHVSGLVHKFEKRESPGEGSSDDKDKKQLQAELAELEVKMAACKSQLRDAEASISRKEEAFARLENELSVSVADLAKQKELTESQLERASTAELEMKNALEAKQNLESELREANSKVQSLTSRIADLTSNKSKSQKTLAKEQDELKVTKTEAEWQLAETKVKVEGLEEELKKAKESKETETVLPPTDHQPPPANSRTENPFQLSLDRSYQRSQRHREGRLGAADERIAALEAELKSANAEAYNKIASQLMDAETSISRKEEACKRLEEELSDLRSQRELKESDDKRASVAELEKKDALAAKQNLETQLKEANSSVQLLTDRIADLENANKSYLDALQDHMTLSKELDDLTNTKTQLAEAREKIVALEEQFNAGTGAEVVETDFEGRLAAANERIAALQEELRSSTNTQAAKNEEGEQARGNDEDGSSSSSSSFSSSASSSTSIDSVDETNILAMPEAPASVSIDEGSEADDLDDSNYWPYEESSEDEGPPPLPPGWIEQMCPRTKMPFYLNKSSNAVTWIRPKPGDPTAAGHSDPRSVDGNIPPSPDVEADLVIEAPAEEKPFSEPALSQDQLGPKEDVKVGISTKEAGSDEEESPQGNSEATVAPAAATRKPLVYAVDNLGPTSAKADFKTVNVATEVPATKAQLPQVQSEPEIVPATREGEVETLEARLKANVDDATVEGPKNKAEQSVIKNLKMELGVCNQEKLDAISARDSLSKDLDEARSKLESLEHTIHDLEEARLTYLDALASQMSHSEEVEEVHASRETAEEKLKETEAQVEDLKSKLEEQEALSQSQSEEAEVAKKELVERKRSQRETMNEIEKQFSDHSEKVHVVTEKLKQKEEELEELEKNAKQTEMQQTTDIKSLKAKLLEQEATSTQLAADVNAKASKITDLEGTLKNKKEEIVSLQEQLQDSADTFSNVEGLTHELKEQLELLEIANERMTELMKLVEDKQNECTSLKAEIESLKCELESKAALEREVESLKTKAEDQKNEQEQMNVAMLAQDTYCASLCEELSNMRDQIAVMESEVNSTGDTASGEMMRLRSECDKFQQLNEELQKERADADDACRTLRGKLASIQGDYERHTQTIVSLQQKLDSRRELEPREKLQLEADLRTEKIAREKLSNATEELEKMLKEKETACNDLMAQVKTLESDSQTQTEDIFSLKASLKSAEDSAAEAISALKKDLAEQLNRQEKMNESMVEMLALWEDKESQCASFTEKLHELTQKLIIRDAQIVKLKQDVAAQKKKMEVIVQELKQAPGAHGNNSEETGIEKLVVVLNEKEKEVDQLSIQLQELSTRHEKQEKEWNMRLAKSENELESLRRLREDEKLKSGDSSVQSQEAELSNRLGTLTSKISEGEKQLADLERDFQEKWESSSVDVSIKSQQSASVDASINAHQKQKKKKSKLRTRIWSRFRR